MRLVTYRSADTWRAGAVVDGWIIDVDQALAAADLGALGPDPSIRQLLRQHGTHLPEVAAAVTDGARPGVTRRPVTEAVFGPPVLDPDKVLCVGLNYADHVAETGRALPQHPDVFVKFATSLIGPQTPIGGLQVTSQLDFEGELAVVIGRQTSGISSEEALEHVAGAMVLNDVTARDLQYRGTQWTMGKAVDRSTPTGPELVTLDEVGDLQQLDIATRVNGVVMQSSNTRHMIFSVAHIIAYIAQTITLMPGDIIATGTPDGIGAKRKPPQWLSAGDVVEVDVQQVGTLCSVVAGDLDVRASQDGTVGAADAS
ncbi:fumarylacetoacetate hydrolase family protein [Kineococcus sp. SYSU DK004]|uniref:fumarylacetoacetate hydrolase family protein n=1 Tax=Kineococcus sp. SYSU DK004 TaxID=3383125 RepID=UPI003D7D9FE1